MPGYPYMDEYRIFDAQAHIASDRLPQYREGGNLRTMSSVTAAGHLLELLDEAGIHMALVGAPCIVSGGPQELLDFNHEFLNGHIAQERRRGQQRHALGRDVIPDANRRTMRIGNVSANRQAEP